MNYYINIINYYYLNGIITASRSIINEICLRFLKENLTDALADLDAALEKESDRLLASEHIANGAEEEEEKEKEKEEEKGGGTSKVEELEKQCKCLESQLDEVKGKRSLFSSCFSIHHHFHRDLTRRRFAYHGKKLLSGVLYNENSIYNLLLLLLLLLLPPYQ